MERDSSRRGRRKLLVASVGVATVSYAVLATACGKESTPVSGNLMPPQPQPTLTPVSGNLAPPEPPPDAAPAPVPDAATPELGTPPVPMTGNMVIPPLPQDPARPRDAGAPKPKPKAAK